MTEIERYKERIRSAQLLQLRGRVCQVVGLVIESEGPIVSIGEVCFIKLANGGYIQAEVVGFRDRRVLLMPLGELCGVSCGCEVIPTKRPLVVGVGEGLCGRVLNALGQPIDGKGEIDVEVEYPIFNTPPNPLQRPRITQVLPVGVRAIDTLLTIGKGQRIGIFSGSGIGKSMLLGMIARNTAADIAVIALIGERGREVRDFIERDLGEEGLSRAVVVVATSDQAPLLRLRGAFVATAIAEYFRDKGYDVIFMMDSITRFARAQREIGLSIGEAPATRGFTPSVFTILPKLLERTGATEKGTITGIYTILVDADDMNEPIADNVRAILDGHIVLSRQLAARGHYPAVDILDSVSRVMVDLVDSAQIDLSHKVREVLATLKDAEDLINIGAYAKGSNRKIDYALSKIDKINEFLRQGMYEKSDYKESIDRLSKIFDANQEQ